MAPRPGVYRAVRSTHLLRKRGSYSAIVQVLTCGHAAVTNGSNRGGSRRWCQVCTASAQALTRGPGPKLTIRGGKVRYTGPYPELARGLLKKLESLYARPKAKTKAKKGDKGHGS